MIYPYICRVASCRILLGSNMCCDKRSTFFISHYGRVDRLWIQVIGHTHRSKY